MKLDKSFWSGISTLLLGIIYFYVPLFILFRSAYALIHGAYDYIRDNIVVFFYHPNSGMNMIISMILYVPAIIFIPIVLIFAWIFLFEQLAAFLVLRLVCLVSRLVDLVVKYLK